MDEDNDEIEDDEQGRAALLRGDRQIRAADASPDYLADCGLPASHSGVGDSELLMTSHTSVVTISAEKKKEIR